MLFSIAVIIIACLLVYAASRQTRKTCTAPPQPRSCMDDDTEEAINALAEYAIALNRRADAITAAARDEADPIKAAKLRADAARLYAQSASQSLKAAKLAKTAK